MRRAIVFILFLAGCWCLGGVRPVGAQVIQPLYIVDHPTAGLLDHGYYEAKGRAGAESSFLASFKVGFKGVFQIGASFGMHDLLGYGSPDLNDKIGFQARVRLIGETNAPALAVGFDNQGRGRYHEDLERYDRKSTGFYVVLSKNYALALGELALHGGLSITTENVDDDDPTLFFGIGWTIMERFSIVLDNDAALNDNVKDGEFGKGGIYVDGALRWYYGESLVMTLIFRDLTGNFGPTRGVGREFEFALIESF